jgi:hypothetical protein
MATPVVTPTPTPTPAPVTAAQAHFNLGLLLQIIAALAPIVAAAASPFVPTKVGGIITTEGNLVGEAGQIISSLEGQQ